MKPMSMRSLVYAPDSNPLLERVTVTAKQRRVYATLKGIHYHNDETGEVSEASVVHAIEEKDDAEFVKIFGAGVAAVYSLGKTAQRVFHALLREYENTPLQGGYADSIYLAWFGDGLCGRDIGMSEKTWQRGKNILEVHDAKGAFKAAQEPGVVELKDGSILMWIRTNAGCQYMSRSTDRGISWSTPEPSALVAPVSPATIKRLPTGDLLAVWNDHTNRPDEAKKAPKWANGRRTPLTTAISRDEGRTWTHVKNIEDDPSGWFCYIALQPLDDGTALLGYCAYKGLAHSRLVKVPIDWFYK